MFGGNPQGGFLDLPTATSVDGQAADIVVVGAPAATPYSSVGNYYARPAERGAHRVGRRGAVVADAGVGRRRGCADHDDIRRLPVAGFCRRQIEKAAPRGAAEHGFHSG